MDLDILFDNIKTLCKKKEINISQLEKELNFSAGSIGKWRHSFPGIDKVCVIADFFQVSIEELCGTEKVKTEKKFMDSLINKTMESDVEWLPCSQLEINNLRFIPSERLIETEEIYVSYFETGKIYFVVRETKQRQLYISVENDICFLQKEDGKKLNQLWQVIKERESELVKRIDTFKDDFI